MSRNTYERLTLIGHIGRTEVQTSEKGNKYVRISVAVDGRQGVKWYSVVVTGAAVANPDRLLEVFQKGRLLLVEGEPQDDIFHKRDGTATITRSILANGLPRVLDNKPEDTPRS
jgi:single-stranded DNA-binding protein